MKSDLEVIAALDEIIEGRNVKRYVHDLRLGGRDYSDVFADRLLDGGFVRTTVGDVEIGFDERVAAFVIRESKAYFGWVFIERFTETKSRKLFGSSVRNSKGDWAIQISPRRREEIFVRYSEKLDMEISPDFVLE